MRLRGRVFYFCLAACIFCPLLPLSFAEGAERNGELLARGNRKHEIWQEGFFRIRFMREGEAAVPAADGNGNGCPDFVEDVAAQLVAAHAVFCEAGGLPSPLSSPRYAGVRYIDVDIRSRKGMKGATGLVYDEISMRPDTRGMPAFVPYRRLPKTPVLLIAVSSDIDPPKNPTPAHEYFHQIQNGMTHFKNTWFYEGMARWSEGAARFSRRGAKNPPPGWTPDRLRHDAAYRESIFAASYAAADLLWKPLAALCPGTGGAFSPGHPALALTYSDGSPVLHGGELSGIRMMRRVLEKLGEAEAIPFDRFSYEKWTEANQRRAENNPVIMDAVLEAAAEMCPR